jgi:hypothetical protein
VINTILTGVVLLATRLADTAAKALDRRQQPLDKPLTKLESEKIIDNMLVRARAMAAVEKARKRLEEDKK